MLCSSSAGAAEITTFPVGGSGTHRPTYIASSPLTGELWFEDEGSPRAIRSINTGGAPLAAITAFPPSGSPTFAPDGTLFWPTQGGGTGGYARRTVNGVAEKVASGSQSSTQAVGVTAGGSVSYSGFTALAGYSVCQTDSSGEGCNGVSGNSYISDFTLAAGHLWILVPYTDTALRLGTDGLSTELTIPLPGNSTPQHAAVGPDGNLWITGFGNSEDAANTTNQIIRLTPDGQQTSFLLPPGRGPADIAAGPDGALWFPESISGSIGRITTTGEYSSCPLPNAASHPEPIGITAGADGAIWFTEFNTGVIGRLTGNCVASSITVLPSVGTGTGTDAKADTTKPVLGGLKLSNTSFKSQGRNQGHLQPLRAQPGRLHRAEEDERAHGRQEVQAADFLKPRRQKMRPPDLRQRLGRRRRQAGSEQLHLQGEARRQDPGAGPLPAERHGDRCRQEHLPAEHGRVQHPQIVGSYSASTYRRGASSTVL